MTDTETRADEIETARRWAVRLEGMLAAAQERAREDLEREHARWRAADARASAAEGELARAKEAQRSQEILRERAEADRDTALQRLSSCAAENAAFRHQRDQAVAANGPGTAPRECVA